MPLGSYDLQQASPKNIEAAKLTLEVTIHNNEQKYLALTIMRRMLIAPNTTRLINKLQRTYFLACKGEMNSLSITPDSTTVLAKDAERRKVTVKISSGLLFDEKNHSFFGPANPHYAPKKPAIISFDLFSNRWLDEIPAFAEMLDEEIASVNKIIIEQEKTLNTLVAWFGRYNAAVLEVRNILAPLGSIDETIAKYAPLITTTPYSYSGGSR